MAFMETDVEYQDVRVVCRPGARTADLAKAIAATLRAHRVHTDEFVQHLTTEAKY